jgi:glycosyltransferase involved in cell wall biosynthesis
MKKYLLITGDFVKTGGMDRANFALADYLLKKGASVELVAYRVASELRSYSNLKLHSVPKIFNSYFLSGFLLNWMGGFWIRTFESLQYKILVNGGCCELGNVNWVHYVHAAYKPQINASLIRRCQREIYYHLCLSAEKKALRAAQVIIVNSNRTREDLIHFLALPSEIIHVCYCGIDPKLFFPIKDSQKQSSKMKLGWDMHRLTVLFIGALGDLRKGFDTLFKAWQILYANPTWDVDLKVIGSGAETSFWQNKVESANLSRHIQFLGFRFDVPDLMQAADCLVAPTRYEAYGLGVHEAICSGIPAIVTRNSGIAERYPSNLDNLLINNPEDENELAMRLAEWRKDKDKYRQLVIPFSEELRSYTWDHMANDIVNIIGGLN